MRILVIIVITTPNLPPTHCKTWIRPQLPPQPRPKGVELSVGRRSAIVVEVALTIPPDLDRHVFAPQVPRF